ncbi:MAG: hypothetical protein ACRD72_13920, partial [Candidatus Angelobacter sp.]
QEQRKGAEHCVVQQLFFRLVGILARSSLAGNAYATLFFVAFNFFQNVAHTFVGLLICNCSKRGATFNSVVTLAK